jgi:hypothetical protein
MQRPPNTRHRAHGRARKKAKTKKAAIPTRRHPSFGDIPTLSVTRTDEQGRTWDTLEYDPDYAPSLPPGAVRGNVRKQLFCPMCHVPRYFYVDMDRVCVQCGVRFVFRAAEQKHWYETLKFYFDSVPTRCLACRRKRRTDRALHRQLSDTKASARQKPDDPQAQLALAEAVVRYFERHGKGPLDAGIAASRKARRLLKNHPLREQREASFWEAMAHAFAGRKGTARKMLLEFVTEARGAGRRQARLAKEGSDWLDREAQ